MKHRLLLTLIISAVVSFVAVAALDFFYRRAFVDRIMKEFKYEPAYIVGEIKNIDSYVDAPYHPNDALLNIVTAEDSLEWKANYGGIESILPYYGDVWCYHLYSWNRKDKIQEQVTYPFKAGFRVMPLSDNDFAELSLYSRAVLDSAKALFGRAYFMKWYDSDNTLVDLRSLKNRYYCLSPREPELHEDDSYECLKKYGYSVVYQIGGVRVYLATEDLNYLLVSRRNGGLPVFRDFVLLFLLTVSFVTIIISLSVKKSN